MKWKVKILFLVIMFGFFINGCTEQDKNKILGGGNTDISEKAITSFSLDEVTGIINEGAKTIAIKMPNGTNVTALVATVTSLGIA